MIYATVTGHKHYFGLLPFSVGTKLTLMPEPENAYDRHAVSLYHDNYGKVGYIAASMETAADGTDIASRIFPLLAGGEKAEVRFIAGDYVILALFL